MNLQPLPHMYVPVVQIRCTGCGAVNDSDQVVIDKDSPTGPAPWRYLCLFCADGHDPMARERVRRAADEQWTRLGPHQRARAIAAKGLPR